MKRKFLSNGNKVLAVALAAAMTFPMLPANSVQAAEAGTPLYTDEAELPAGWTVGAGSVSGVNTDKGGNTSNKLALVNKAKADYKLASAVSTGHVKLEYEVFNEGVANAMVVYDSDGKALINLGGAGSGNMNIMPGYPDGAASGTDYATSGKVFEWVGGSKAAWRKVVIDIDLDKSNKDGVLNFTLNVYEPDGDYKGKDTKWKLFAAEDTENGQKRDGQFTQDAYVKPRGNNKGGNIVDAGTHANGAATPGVTKFSVAGIQLVSAGEGPFYDNMVLTAGAADAGSASTPAPEADKSTPAPEADKSTPAPEKDKSTPAPEKDKSTPAPSTSATISPDGTYTVQRGDTLYGIAKKLLGNGSKWIDLYNLNSATIKNAKLIFAGQVLQINGSASTTTTPSAPSTPSEPSTPAAPEAATAGEVKNLAASAQGSHDFTKQQRVLTATLTWDAVAGASSYDVYRDGTKIGTASGNTYEDTAYDVNGKVEYAVAVAGSSSKTSITVTQVGFDMTSTQEQKDKDKNPVMPETLKSYTGVVFNGKNEKEKTTLYEKGKTAGFTEQVDGRWRANELSTMDPTGWSHGDLRGGEVLSSADKVVTFKADVANGTYDVWILSCSLDAKTQATSAITVSGGDTQTLVAAEKGQPVEGHLTAKVTDGVLTIEMKSADDKGNWGRLNAVIITQTK